jgi:formate hydrogenlyase subunit 6/NADH:ubiquinone oxidoreductase subunit I
MTALYKITNVEQVVTGNLCTGCSTCVAFCPQNAVAMKESLAGLLYPEIDHKTCNFCGLCLK